MPHGGVGAARNSNEHFSIGVGVPNLIDKAPPYVSVASLSTDPALYDVIGWTWVVSTKGKFWRV